MGFRYGDYDLLNPYNSGKISETRVLSQMELSRYLQTELEQGALEKGLSLSEAQSFFQEYQWIDRLITKASQNGKPCAIFNFSGEDYDQFIPLTSSHALSERVRIMWVFVDNVPAVIKGNSFWPMESALEGLSTGTGADLVFHEYGVIEENNPVERSARELSMFSFQFRDEFLVDETNYHDNNIWNPIFHTFGEHPVAQLLTAGVTEVYGSISSPIVVDPAGTGFVVMGGDDDTYSDMGNEFPAGSYPPVAVAEAIGDGWFIAINDINFLNTHPDNVQFLQNCFEFLADYESRVIHVPGDVASIQAAIDSALAGDTVLVAPGVYYENIDFSGKNICVMSAAGAAETTIYGDSTIS
ncbi:MAG: hypothetical protein L3J79_05845, partial [Candidatus Marinimicrobia bacterium]|nr:hypothetical protein [Candidatus Neomarinimicrobiota bacterium]